VEVLVLLVFDDMVQALLDLLAKKVILLRMFTQIHAPLPTLCVLVDSQARHFEICREDLLAYM
jgi:hypothetical protein